MREEHRQSKQRKNTHLDSVGCQEQNALEILELAEENADQRISMDVMHIPLLEEHVSLVQEQNSTPRVADVKNLL